MESQDTIFEKLKQSKVFKVLSGYAIAAFVTVQVASLVSDSFGFGDEFMQDLIPYFTKWRDMGIRINCYPTAHKLKKQMQFANCTNAPFVMFYGNDEQQKGIISIKNMLDGKNNFIKLKDFSKKSIIKILKK